MDSGASGTVIKMAPARLPDDLAMVKQLFLAYAEGLGFKLCFQNFDDELATLPGKYAPPLGRLILAWDGDHAVGCVALRAVDAQTCEMKRLYVAPGYRAQQLGRRLAERICQEAREAQYQRICLDTLPTMQPALRLYDALGFQPTAPYVFNPLEGAIFLALDLTRPPAPTATPRKNSAT